MKTKDIKRSEAEARQAKYDRLTRQEKVQLIVSRRGNSARELARVEATR